MARQSPKPPNARSSVWAIGSLAPNRRRLTKEQFAEMRRKLADLDTKLWQLTTAERERRR
jgi:hypothetical protein